MDDLVAALRSADLAAGGGLTAVDILTLYAATRHWFAPRRATRDSPRPRSP